MLVSVRLRRSAGMGVLKSWDDVFWREERVER